MTPDLSGPLWPPPEVHAAWWRVGWAILGVGLVTRGGRWGEHGWRLAAAASGAGVAGAWGAVRGPAWLGAWNDDLAAGSSLLGAALVLWGELITPRLPLAVIGATVAAGVVLPLAVLPVPLALLGGAALGAWSWRAAPRAWSSAVGALALLVAWGPVEPAWAVWLALAAAGTGLQWATSELPPAGDRAGRSARGAGAAE